MHRGIDTKCGVNVLMASRYARELVLDHPVGWSLSRLSLSVRLSSDGWFGLIQIFQN